MNLRILKFLLILLAFGFTTPQVYAQLGKITFDLEKDKPEKFKSKTLRSERTGEKKFNVPRRFIQNTTSHYNYYFNANNKINAVIERARISHKDDYSKLIPYYSFDLKQTAAQASELDSVILKSTAGILLHDLRSDWVDNFYLLIGKAYFLRKDFDSAGMTFQFINFNLFPRKKKGDDDQQIVGTTGFSSTNSLSISSKENRNLLKKAFSQPPSRNDALVWQIRTLIEMENYGEAAGLINTLKNDENFPGRLNAYLEEMEGYWFYKQQMYDSAISHIEKALPNALDNADKARREFLLAQLYEITGDQSMASDYYDKAIRHTTDPLMDIYGNLNKAKMLKSKDPQEIVHSVNRLLRMARKNKFDAYRDIIYFSAAQLAMEIPDSTAAMAFFGKSISFNENNTSYRNRAFLNLAEMSYEKKDYKNAYNFYDSLRLPDSTLGDIAAINEKKAALVHIVRHIKIIERQDSLQALAALSPADRDAYLKKLSRSLKKQRGVSEEDEYVNSSSAFFDSKNRSSDIFGNNDAKGEWYFYNNSLKAKGLNEFKKTWGKRDNIDNWRRLSSDRNAPITSNKNQQNITPDQLATGDIDPLSPANMNKAAGMDGEGKEESDIQQDISVSGLAANIPLTQEAMDVSNKKIATSLFQLGKNYQVLLEDFHAAIDRYEYSLERFPDSLYNGEIYMNLFYCYNKLGNTAKANHYKNLLLKTHSDSRFADYVLNPEKFDPSRKDETGTKIYQEIYNLFIEGDFKKALEQKKAADNLYGLSFWSPQLLYIESVYYINNREDSTAISILNQLMTQYPASPMSDKAATMINVLNRRDSIESYLTNLEIERIKPGEKISVFDDTKVVRKTQDPGIIVPEKTIVKQIENPKAVEISQDKKLPPPVVKSGYSFDANSNQNVVMILTKVDPVYNSEARNAFIRYNAQKHYRLDLKVTRDTLDNERALLVFTEFPSAEEALKYLDQLRKDVRTQLSWLPAEKYSFMIISEENLEILKNNKNLQDYIDLLKNRYPEKF
ncbi:MAG: tetratricopeptide repeat protein [Ginsengibacter sp.]